MHVHTRARTRMHARTVVQYNARATSHCPQPMCVLCVCYLAQSVLTLCVFVRVCHPAMRVRHRSCSLLLRGHRITNIGVVAPYQPPRTDL